MEEVEKKGRGHNDQGCFLFLIIDLFAFLFSFFLSFSLPSFWCNLRAMTSSSGKATRVAELRWLTINERRTGKEGESALEKECEGGRMREKAGSDI